MEKNLKYSIMFRDETEKHFNNIAGHNLSEVEDIVLKHIEDSIETFNIDAEVVNLAVYGSRSRGKEIFCSDLDVVVELATAEREDGLFDLLNLNKLQIGGIGVDINPITTSIDEYLKKADLYMKTEEYEDQLKHRLDQGLYEAVKTGSYDLIEKYITCGADVNFKYMPEELNYSPLHWAAYYNNIHLIELLIEHNANINCCSVDGESPLSMAISRHNNKECVELLKEKGAMEYTAPIPDFSEVGELYYSCDHKLILVCDDGILKTYDKQHEYKAIQEAKQQKTVGTIVDLQFNDDVSSDEKVFYMYSLKHSKKEKEISKTDEAQQGAEPCINLHAYTGVRRRGR